jgi:hypothetical protein
MAPNFKQILGSLDARLRSLTKRANWRIAAYVIERDSSTKRFLRKVESIGDSDGVVEFVVNAACITRTTVLGDVAKIVESLKQPSELAHYRPLGAEQVAAASSAGKAEGSVIGAPCFDPWQTITNDQTLGRVVGALGVAGNVSPEEVVSNADWRYLVEEYAKAVAFVLRPRLDNPNVSLGADWTLPEIEVVQGFSDRIAGDSKDSEPYTSHGERWLQFGPGLVVSKSGYEAFARGWSQRQADHQYIQSLDKMSW